MPKIFSPAVSRIKPTRESVYFSLGISQPENVSIRTSELFSVSMEWFLKLTQPIGKMTDISIEEFGLIFDGSGNNENETPLQGVFPRAEKLALMAFTLGEDISHKISSLFEKQDFALGAILDAIASRAAENATVVAEGIFSDLITADHTRETPPVVLLYSPGYCGWHISGQKHLFDYLKPEEIGIRLNNRFLMTPLKSISGVLVAGGRKIHFFKNNFPFCDVCTHQTCVERMNRIKQNGKEIKHGNFRSDFTISAAGR